MSKSSSKDRPGNIEIQRGPISMNEQYSMAFPPPEGPTRLDMEHNALRRSGHTLTKHEPKR